jgi:hypothetical protein
VIDTKQAALSAIHHAHEALEHAVFARTDALWLAAAAGCTWDDIAHVLGFQTGQEAWVWLGPDGPEGPPSTAPALDAT